MIIASIAREALPWFGAWVAGSCIFLTVFGRWRTKYVERVREFSELRRDR